jgi:hypothetical protein
VKENAYTLSCALVASVAFTGFLAGCGGGGSTPTPPVKTTPTITWANPAAVPAGTALTATQLDATASVAGAFAYTPALGTVLSTVGSNTLSVAFTPNDTTDYNSASGSATITVNSDTPTITWATPAAVTVGAALSSTQLDATSNVAGTFAYTPTSGVVLTTAGTTTLSTTFTPTNPLYTTATDSVSLTVNKATPIITWATPSAVNIGATLSSTQLDATANVAGTFAYTPASGTVLSSAGSVTLSTTFTPTDAADYNTATDSVTLTVSTPGPSYSWSNVKIIAGGYVPGLYFHPTKQGLMYARTDIGSAYRWGPNDTEWVPLTDWNPPATWWYGGTEAIGLDPTDPNRLYLAVGEYALETYDGNGAMLVSDDMGNTFTTVPLPFRNGSNDTGRNAGERIAVDPKSPNIVYFGTRVAGLQISLDHGSTWNPVTGLPVTTTANGSGVVSVVPISSSGKSGSATPAIYVAVAGTGVTTGSVTDPVGLYVTSTGGTATSTWTPVPGQPSFATAATPLAPLHAILGPNGNLYVLYADQPGPYSITTSQLWKYTLPSSSAPSGTWKQITIPPNMKGNTAESGYGGIAADPSNPGVLLLATIDQYYPGDTIYRSLDDGATWVDVSAVGGTHDATLSPYLAFGGSVSSIGSGNWVGSVVIDPFNPAHVMYGTGATIWQSTNLTDADSSKNVNWTVGANGVEETAVGPLEAPPSGATLLLSSMGDIYGFAHTDLTISPAQGMYSNPMATPSSIDFEQTVPTTAVRVTNGTTPYGVISTNGGLAWTAFATMPTGTTKGGGTIAIASDGSSMVWSPADTASVWYSTNNGATWTASTGIPAQTQVVSDRVKPGVYYGLSAGSLYVSTNGGQTWTSQLTTLSSSASLVILPDAEGDLWVTSSGGLLHNTGTATAPSLTGISGPTSASYLGFGKAASASGPLTLYVYGVVSGTTGLFRSADGGATWIQINDTAHQWGGSVNSVTGDLRTFGTVYVGTNGRGIIWGTSTF